MISIEFTTLEGTQKRVKVPITWHDVTWSKFVQLEAKKELNAISKLAFVSGIDEAFLLNNPFFLKGVIDACEFMFTATVDEYETFIRPDHKKLIVEKKCDTIGELPWGKIEFAKTKIKSNDNNVYSSANDIVKEYLGIEINELPCTEVIGLVAFFLPKSESSLNDTAT